MRIRKVKSFGFIKVLTQLQSLIIFCASAEIFETFFFQLLLPGKTLHVSQGSFAQKVLDIFSLTYSFDIRILFCLDPVKYALSNLLIAIYQKSSQTNMQNTVHR